MNRMENIRGAITRDRDALNALLDNLDENELEKALQFLLESSLTVTSACGSSGFAAKWNENARINGGNCIKNGRA